MEKDGIRTPSRPCWYCHLALSLKSLTVMSGDVNRILGLLKAGIFIWALSLKLVISSDSSYKCIWIHKDDLSLFFLLLYTKLIY